MKRVASYLIPLVMLAAMLTGCKSDEEEFDQSLLIGYWNQDNTEQYYHFMSGGTGKFWDESDYVTEDDVQENGNGYFTWKLTGNRLSLSFTIEINQGGVPKNYILKQLTGSRMVYKDGVTTKTFTRSSR